MTQLLGTIYFKIATPSVTLDWNIIFPNVRLNLTDGTLKGYNMNIITYHYNKF